MDWDTETDSADHGEEVRHVRRMLEDKENGMIVKVDRDWVESELLILKDRFEKRAGQAEILAKQALQDADTVQRLMERFAGLDAEDRD